MSTLPSLTEVLQEKKMMGKVGELQMSFGLTKFYKQESVAAQ